MAEMSWLTGPAILLSYTTILSQGAPVGECCKEKSVGETVYTLVKEGNTKEYGCLDNCIYHKKDMPGNMICFKAGSLPVDCLEENGNTDIPSTMRTTSTMNEDNLNNEDSLNN